MTRADGAGRECFLTTLLPRGYKLCLHWRFGQYFDNVIINLHS